MGKTNLTNKPEILINFGFTKNEAILYLTLLKLGESKVSKIIKESKFRSGKIYQVLESLINKGIISYVIKNKIKYYQPQDPIKIKDYIRLKKRELELEELEFSNYLPKLEQLFKTKKESCSVKVYEGIEGIRSALFSFLENLSKNSKIFIYGANDDQKRDAILLWRKYDLICHQKNIKSKIIMCSLSEKGRKLRSGKNEYKSYRFLKGKDISNFMVGSNMVLIFNFNQPNCILIDNFSYANQFSTLFNMLWKIAKKI